MNFIVKWVRHVEWIHDTYSKSDADGRRKTAVLKFPRVKLDQKTATIVAFSSVKNIAKYKKDI